MKRLVPTMILLLAGCDFAKQPYLFVGLAGYDGGTTQEDAEVQDATTQDAATAGNDDAATAPDAAAPITGTALLITGVDQGLSASARGFLPSDGAARTFEAWIRGPSAPGSGRLFAYGPLDHNFQIYVSGGFTPRLNVNDGIDNVGSAVAPPLGDMLWHHIAIVLTATTPPDSHFTIQFFVDGDQISSTTKPGTDARRADPLRLVMGGNPAEPIGFTHLELDEVRLWSVARTASEIRDHRREILTDAPGLVGYWSMDQTGAGPGIPVDNLAVNTASRAPSLFTERNIEFVPSTAF